jgi:hypothetical protein
VRRPDIFLKTEILDVTFGEKPGKNGKNPTKNRYFTKIDEFVANESSFGIYTRKTKEILFEI